MLGGFWLAAIELSQPIRSFQNSKSLPKKANCIWFDEFFENTLPLVTDQEPEIGIKRKRGFLRLVEQWLFFIFWHICDDFSKFRSAAFGLLYFGKLSKIPKLWQKMKKSLVQLALNQFLHGRSKTRVSDTQSVTNIIYLKKFLEYFFFLPSQGYQYFPWEANLNCRHC